MLLTVKCSGSVEILLPKGFRTAPEPALPFRQGYHTLNTDVYDTTVASFLPFKCMFIFSQQQTVFGKAPGKIWVLIFPVVLISRTGTLLELEFQF